MASRMGAGEIPAIGMLLVNRYEITAEIGRGGCAAVFEAHDHRLGRLVAVKVPLGFGSDPIKTARFQRESRVISAIHHPNVCAVLDTGAMPRGTPFLVMERLFGESLRATLARRDRLSVGDTLAIATQLLSALDAVHESGIVHRDVKPDNIILVGRPGCDPVVKLLDFGLCRYASRGTIPPPSIEATMTTEGAIVGTPEYMAPEQVIGSKPDLRVDIYAVGVVLYEMLSGDRTFFAKSVREILNGVMNKYIVPLRDVRKDVPRSLDAVVAQAMARDPAHRQQSALELQQALRAVREEMNSAAFVAPATPGSPGWDLPTAKLRQVERRIPRVRRITAAAPTPRVPIPLPPPSRH